MKKIIILIGVFAAIFLMVSTATAVPQVQSRPVIEKVNNAERLKVIFENIEKQKDILDSKKFVVQTGLIRLFFWYIKVGFLAIITILGSFIFGFLNKILHPIDTIMEFIKNALIEGLIKSLINLLFNGAIRAIFGKYAEFLIGIITGEFNPFS